MKKTILLAFVVLFFIEVFSTVPQRFSYQAVVRNEKNILVTNSIIGIQISILQSSTTDNAVYIEQHSKTTNSNGLISVEIGSGVVVYGDFSKIDWSSGTYFIKTEFDFEGGTNYIISGITKMLSVPFALHANTVNGTDVLYRKLDSLKSENNALKSKINSFVVSTKNLFDKSKITSSKYMGSTGLIGDNTLYGISDYIPLKENQSIVMTKAVITAHIGINLYDSTKQLISTISNTNPITGIVNTAYMRFSFLLKDIDLVQAEYGNVPTMYQAYGYEFSTQCLPQYVTNKSEAVLPDTLFLVKNKSVNLYFDSFLTMPLNESNTTAKFIENFGNNYSRQFNAIPNTDSSNQPLTLTLWQNGSQIQQYSYKYNVTDPTKNTGKKLNLLFIGDSFTQRGIYIQEIKRLLEQDGLTVNLLGTTGPPDKRCEGYSGGKISNIVVDTSSGVSRNIYVDNIKTLPLSGWNGTTYKDDNGSIWSCKGYKINDFGTGKMTFTTEGVSDMSSFPNFGKLKKVNNYSGDSVITYTRADKGYFNSFINPETKNIDFNYYINYWDFSIPDIVVLQFMWNDLAAWATDQQTTDLIGQTKKAIDAIHTAFPNCKIIYSIEPFGAINSSTIDIKGRSSSFFKFSKGMIEQYERNDMYKSFVKIAPSYAWVDRVNGYSNLGKSLNDRFPDVIESTSADPIHCNDNGMKQISDCIYPIIHFLLLKK
ncbi:MAG: hypothetical protein WCK78_14805 [Paludibacter sp.]